MSHPDFAVLTVSEVGPAELDRHIRGWLVEVRERHSGNTARGWFAGVRHFCRWMESEGETDRDATAGIRTGAPGDPETAVLTDEGRPHHDRQPGAAAAPLHRRRRCHRHRRAEGQGPAGAGERPPDAVDQPGARRRPARHRLTIRAGRGQATIDLLNEYPA